MDKGKPLCLIEETIIKCILSHSTLRRLRRVKTGSNASSPGGNNSFSESSSLPATPKRSISLTDSKPPQLNLSNSTLSTMFDSLDKQEGGGANLKVSNNSRGGSPRSPVGKYSRSGSQDSTHTSPKRTG